MEQHVVLQFDVENTIDDQRLANVTVSLETDGDLYQVTGEIAAESIKYGESGKCFRFYGKGKTESSFKIFIATKPFISIECFLQL